MLLPHVERADVSRRLERSSCRIYASQLQRAWQDQNVTTPRTGPTPRAGPSVSAGEDLDPRWSLANERTLLAYMRTALSVLVAGLAIAGTHTVTHAPVWLSALGLPLIALGAIVALSAKRRFFAIHRAMSAGEPLSVPPLASTLPWAIAVVAGVGLVLASVALASS